VELPMTGEAWQVMRPSRNRNWGNPRLIDFIERFARDARTLDHWPGLLIGDLSQPTNANWACQPPNRARCRYLADANA
jgi:penicillin-insensitive murein endopeptidase